MNLESTNDLFGEPTNPWLAYKPKVTKLDNSPPTYLWDVPYTISQLAYLTHNHFRYYGKFPSVIAGQILDDIGPRSGDGYVLDNFCGSGTTLVEAKLRGIRSFGVDISWLGALASNVKVTAVDFEKVRKISARLLHAARASGTDELPSDKYRDKWFPIENAKQLQAMQHELLLEGPSPERDFCLVAFLAIIRRVSRAYDGEVRPHINKNKIPRLPSKAFAKKVEDMIARHREYFGLCSSECFAKCIVGDNRKLTSVDLPAGDCALVISHPPYLNSFDYSPVFKQEYYWSEPFRGELDDEIRRSAELRAWPATEQIVEDYYKGIKVAHQEAFNLQKCGGRLAIVIGDCTIQKLLEPVVANCITIVENIGYRLDAINCRTTHYGLGKYAYRHRADYHGKAEKRDAILYFSKP